MKYTLNESIKFILNERFILTEASSPTDAKPDGLKTDCNTLLTFIKKELDAVSGTPEGTEAIQNAINNLRTQTSKLMQDLKNVKDVDIARGHAKDYINAVDNFIKVIKPTDPNWDTANPKTDLGKVFQELNAWIGKSDAKFHDLVKAVNKIKPAIDAFSKDIGKITIASKKKMPAEEQHRILAHLYEDVYKLTQIEEPEWTSWDANSKKIVCDAINALLPLATHAKLADFLTEAAKYENKDDNSAFAKTIQYKDIGNYDRTKMDQERQAGKSWSERLKAAGNDKEAFWNEYYKTVWGANAGKVAALGPAFRQQCEVLGFEKAANPFIGFVEKYVVSAGYPVDKAHYEAIHNAIANRELEKTVVSTPEYPITADNDIIFWADFYNKSSPSEYLTLFAGVCKFDYSKLKTTDVNTLGDNKQLYKNLQLCNNQDDFIKVIMSNNTNTSSLLNSDLSSAPSSSNNLRAASDIRQIVNALGITTDSKKRSYDKDAIEALAADLEAHFTPVKDWAKWIIIQLMDARGFGPDAINQRNNVFSKYSALKSVVVPASKKEDVIKEINKFGNVIPWGTILDIAEKFNDDSRKWLE